ncbi:hypothetical protein SAMN05443245_3417 [Paraburkholderia fungorum]|uniref:Uncharacterized protein n=1 Tax=Paraburkholderia fungorum TaxID=134537 RepID=A0A1H1H046_9BURK|nr:hypothetical protein [Paraburkholderia fungorum]SDR18797.1 hypothetical protein SAMN05443245_3417 [Paraburkholderia fungorum]
MLVDIPDGVGYFRHGRRIGRAVVTTYARTRKIETTVYRVALVNNEPGPKRVRVDVWVPEHHRGGFIPGDLSWVGDGIYRTFAYVDENRNTLAAFLASGDQEWDVREQEA